MRYEIPDEAIDQLCEGCPLMRCVHSGWIGGEWINPPEYDCPCGGTPELGLDGWEVFCKVRVQAEE